MPKYRSLTAEELKALEPEFIDYLIVNGIDAGAWEKLKQEQTEEANRIVALFSDVVLEGVLRKASYLEHRTAKQLKVFQCLAEKMVLMALELPADSSYDLSADDIPASFAVEGVRVYSAEKAYAKQRELELFDMMQGGCMITDDALFKTLALQYATTAKQ